MSLLTNQKLKIEAAATPFAFAAMTDSGDHLVSRPRTSRGAVPTLSQSLGLWRHYRWRSDSSSQRNR